MRRTVPVVPPSEVASLFAIHAQTLQITNGKYPEQRIYDIKYFCRSLAEATAGVQVDFAGRNLFEQYRQAANDCDNVCDRCIIYLSLALRCGQSLGISVDKLRQYGIPSSLVDPAVILTIRHDESVMAWNRRINANHTALYAAESLVKQKLRIDNVPEVVEPHRNSFHNLLDMLVDIHSNNIYQFNKANRHIEIVGALNALLGFSGYGKVLVNTEICENKVTNSVSISARDGSLGMNIATMSMELNPEARELTLVTIVNDPSLQKIIKSTVVQSYYSHDKQMALRILNNYATRFKVYAGNL